MPSSHEPPHGGRAQIRPPLRLVQPAPVQPEQPRTRGGRKRPHQHDVFTDEEQARLLAALRNARFLLGTWKCLADAMRVQLTGLEPVYRGSTPVSAAIAIRLARALGVPVESLYRPPSDAGRCATCGATRGASMTPRAPAVAAILAHTNTIRVALVRSGVPECDLDDLVQDVVVTLWQSVRRAAEPLVGLARALPSVYAGRMGTSITKGLWLSACWLAAAGMPACDDTEGDSTVSTGGGDSTVSTGGGDSTAENCDAERPCYHARVDLSGEDCEGGEPIGVEEEDSARCVLEQLRDGTRGILGIDQSPPAVEGFGYCGVIRYVHILEDRNAFVLKVEYADLVDSEMSHNAKLKTAEHYQKCLDDGPQVYAKCLADALVILEGHPVCTCEYCEY